MPELFTSIDTNSTEVDDWLDPTQRQTLTDEVAYRLCEEYGMRFNTLLEDDGGYVLASNATSHGWDLGVAFARGGEEACDRMYEQIILDEEYVPERPPFNIAIEKTHARRNGRH